jgi:hypothetical protein
MSVNIIWSLTNGGDPATSVIDHGNVGNGATSTALEVFVRHDGGNEITNVGLFVRRFTGTYSGGFTATSDFNELIGWGNGSTADAFGGVQFHMNAISAYLGDWPTYSAKTGVLLGSDVSHVCRTGIGDSEGNAITIPTATGATTAGEIQAGASPNVRFKMRVVVPTAEDTVGIRQWENLLRYTYTS